MGRHGDLLVQLQCDVPHALDSHEEFLFGAMQPGLSAQRSRIFPTAFEQGREEEPPDDQGKDDTESIQWSAEWKTMHDIHTAEKAFRAFQERIGERDYHRPLWATSRRPAPARGGKKEEDAPPPEAAAVPKAKVKAKAKAAPATDAPAPAGQAA
ncbi:hypothetical protein AK812_SmicGene16324 [Symbiodinium microadriaticum]|uniref:Uncharacterized protein n=1 Tax=Symbiodinium microadriaticum TaxID=2951 RepID=A0A1Q9E0K8_SYMMI|nr:hypothetical protein AK812_SmicGene16324 [Symbiodinium microadriaticum]